MASGDAEQMLDRYAQEYANDPEFVAEGLAIKVTEEMLECLELKGRKRTWLADQMGVSRAHVSRILNARPNMTLLTIAKIAVALKVKPDVCLDSEPWRFNWSNPTPPKASISAAGEPVLNLVPSLVSACSGTFAQTVSTN
jgi:antitoxin component HigA of HigAB toxin-antitoxin module